MKKTLHQDYYYEWGEGIIENESFLEHLSEFVEIDEDNGNEFEIDDFIGYLEENEGSNIDAITDVFDMKEDKYGVGREIGADEFSWCLSDYTKDAQIYISGYLNNKQVF